MAEKNVFVVDELGGSSYIVVAESGSQAKNAVKKELTVRRASALEVVEATARGATMMDAEKVLAERAALIAAAGAGKTSEPDDAAPADPEPDAAGAPEA